MSSLSASIGPALRLLRHRRGRKQCEVAAVARITQAMLSAYERGSRRPSLPTLDRVVSALEVGVGELAAAVGTIERHMAAAALRGEVFRVEMLRVRPAQTLHPPAIGKEVVAP